MGAALETPVKCPLCDQLTADPVTLKCNHRFCQRCLGDLWSVSPAGPFRCPQWRCSASYKTMPFDSSVIWPPSAASRRTPTSSPAGGPSNGQQGRSESTPRRSSLASRLLGKRKASTPAPEQPDTKRATQEPSCVRPSDVETPSTPAEQPGPPLGVEAIDTGANQESAQSECRDDSSPPDNADSHIPHTSHVPQDVSEMENQKKPRELITLEDSDSADEIDLCDSPSPSTPKKDAPSTGFQAFLKKVSNSSPANSESSPGISATGNSPASGAPSRPGVFVRSESKASGPVRCHYCPKAVYKSAVRTCLVCGASMCSEHLRPHMESPVFQSHTLVPPVADISLWRCQDHQEINRIYCRQCAACVCTMCTVIGSHRDHTCISIREAERELRGNLSQEIRQLQLAEQEVRDRLTELNERRDTFKAALSEARSGVQQQYGAIREALEQEEQSALQCVAKEESRALGGMEEKLGQLQSSLQSIQQGLKSLEALANTKDEERIQEQAFIMEYSKVAQLASEVGSSVDQFEAPQELDHTRLKCLQRWTEKRLDAVVLTEPRSDHDLYRLLYGTIPVLDADTAHPKLRLSGSGRTVTHTEIQQAYADREARFSSFPQVLASRPLQGGRWYWEVDVPADDGRWKVGLCEGQMERKGQKDSCRLGFNASSWCLACDKRKLEALHNKVAAPVATDGLRRVGVFLDFDEGILSFFNVTAGGSLALVHSYKHKFTEPLYPALSVTKTQLAICDLFQLQA